MKRIYLIIAVIALFASCQKQEFIDTGKAEAPVDKTMLEYMKGDDYNWGYTVAMIERAGLTDLFEGKDPNHPDITFLGPTSISIRKWMYHEQRDWETWEIVKPSYFEMSEVPVETCKEMILAHVIPEKLMKSNIPEGVTTPITGGKKYTTLYGNEVWMGTYQTSYSGVPKLGPLVLNLIGYKLKLTLASIDIECENGVVHSLHYDYFLGEIKKQKK